MIWFIQEVLQRLLTLKTLLLVSGLSITALSEAIANGRVDIIKVLIVRNANVNPIFLF